jgi:hypothetical protein
VFQRTSVERPKRIVGFHGCYQHRDTCNVILEWASLGNLEECFQKLAPPESADDAFLLLHAYFGLLGALDFWRNMKYDNKSAYQL